MTVPAAGSTQITAAESPWERVAQSRSFRILRNFLILPLVGTMVSGLIIGRIANAFIGPSAYYVYIVGDGTDASVKAMLVAAREGQFPSDVGGIPVKVDVRDDSGDPEMAAGIAQQLAARSDVLMVIGHVYSSTTRRALPIYMQADPPIPVILTTETNPTLLPTPPPTDDRVPPVFRLFPTDQDQANMAAAFVESRHAKSLWVVEDVTNPTYSQYLAKQFMKAVYDSHPSLKVILWSNSLNLPPYAVDKMGIDWVFFAGEWRNALVLVRQLQAMATQGHTPMPRMLLSDASADSLLLKYGGTDVEGVYLLHPMTAKQFTETEYKAVGKEAHDLTAQLLQDVHERFDELATEGAPVGYRLRQWLGLRRVSDARRAAARFMEMAVNTKTAIPLSDGKEIKMDRNDDRAVVRTGASFHVWEVSHGRFVDR
jgi:branched-chain amino acid transport system substrate-binding protein